MGCVSEQATVTHGAYSLIKLLKLAENTENQICFGSSEKRPYLASHGQILGDLFSGYG